MKVHNIYANYFSTIIRIVAILASILFLVSNIFRLASIDNGYYSLKELDEILTFSFNWINIVLCIFLAIFPKKIEIITILAFLISFYCFLDYSNPMAILMFFLGYNTLLARGFFNKQKKRKYSFLIIFYLLLWMISIRFGVQKFLIGLLIKIAYSFILILTYFFFTYFLHIQEEKKRISTLNIAEYKNLDSRDAKILNMILSHIKYEAIAPEVSLGLGSLKNRLKIIYNILEVGDKHGFLNKYEGFEIIYEKEYIDKK